MSKHINLQFIRDMLSCYPDLMNATEFAEAFGLSVNGAIKIIERDVDGAFKVGGRWRIPKESIIAYIVKNLEKS